MATGSKPVVDLAALGLNQSEITEMVVERICSQIIREDFDYDEFQARTNNRVEATIKQRIDDAIEKLGDKYIAPNVLQLIETWQLQQTSGWGEKTAPPISFTEYLVQRGEAYLREKVNYEGKPKGSDSYNWKGEQERLAWMIDKHLQYHIENAMKAALQTVNNSLSASIAETVRMQLSQLKVSIGAVQVKS